MPERGAAVTVAHEWVTKAESEAMLRFREIVGGRHGAPADR